MRSGLSPCTRNCWNNVCYRTVCRTGDQIAAYLQIVLAVAIAALAARVARMLVPGFRSQESKSGSYRPGSAATTSSRLPLVGGPAILLAVVVVSTLAGAGSRMLTVVAAAVLFFLIGFMDDLRKARTGRGFGDGTSFLLAVVTAAAAAAVLATVDVPDAAFSLRRWTGFGAAGDLVFGGWLFVLFLTVAVSTGISDGVDGLTTGLAAIAGLGVALAAGTAATVSGGWAVGGAAIGVLLLNMPSAWVPRGPGKRRAQVYLGDSGALLLGGLLTASAVAGGVDLLLPLIVGIFLLEGASSVVQAKLLVPLYRRSARLGGPDHRTVHYSAFSLPFVAAPLHHHLELIGLGRMTLVVLLWGLGVLLATMAVLLARIGPGDGAMALYAAGVAVLVGLWLVFASLRPARLSINEKSGTRQLLLTHGWKRAWLGMRLALTARRYSIGENDLPADGLPLDRALNPAEARERFDAIVAGLELEEETP